MANQRNIPKIKIDKDRLKNAIESHNWTIGALSEDMGFSPCYLTGIYSKRDSMMPVRVVKLLETYGIHQSDYEYIEPEIPEVEEQEDQGLPWDEPEVTGTITVRLDEAQFNRLLSELTVIIREQTYESMARIWGVEK